MTYIILRNNKESAPLSFEQVINAGLKPDDLVWVEGQSVCWLNPGEIRELREFLNGQQPPPVTVIPSPVAEVEVVPPPATEQFETVTQIEEHNRYLPHDENLIAQPDDPLTEEAFAARAHAVKQKAQAVKASQHAPAIVFPNNMGSYPIKAKEEPETKYSMPLDEIKEMYVKTLEQRMKTKGFTLVIPPAVKKVAMYAGLIVIGVIVGLLIKNSGDNNNVSGQYVPIANNTRDINNVADPSVTAAAEKDNAYSENMVDEPVVQESPSNPSQMEEQDEDRPVRKKKPSTFKADNNDEPVEENTPVVTKLPEETRVVKEPSQSEMRSMVAVATNDYTVGSFGGIKNLQLTVTNSSRYNLDQVVVELKYLKPGDEFIKSENISFYSVGANDSKTIAVPKSNRGVKVSYRVVRVESKEASNTTAGL